MATLRYLVQLLLLTANIQALSQSTLTGKLTDRQTGEPVPYASVYFVNTTLGTSSMTDGTFSINRIPDGKYDLLVEMVGYRRHRQSIEFDGGAYRLEILLDQDTVELAPISVVAESDKKYLPVFVRFFVGDDQKAKDCSIINPEILHIYFDAKKNYLSVSAREPVKILNPVLGYMVYYTLDQFGLDFSLGVKSIEGIPRFQELLAQRPKDTTIWKNKRNQAYRGSLLHFVRALYHGKLDEEGFNVYIVDSLRSNAGPEVLRPFTYEALVSNDNVRQLNFQGVLKVEYRESEAREYPGRFLSSLQGRNPKGFQVTYIELHNPFLKIYENGYYSDQKSVYLNGYLVWKETISNMMPLGFVPAVKKRKK